MTVYRTAHSLATLASEGGEHGGNHESLSPYLTGGAALLILLVLLLVTLSFNRDR